jgi:hypothetical protein
MRLFLALNGTTVIPQLPVAAWALGTSMIIDGEAVVLDGRKAFRLRDASSKCSAAESGKRRSSKAMLFAF